MTYYEVLQEALQSFKCNKCNTPVKDANYTDNPSDGYFVHCPNCGECRFVSVHIVDALIEQIERMN